MNARLGWAAVFAVLCSSAAAAQTDTTAGATPALTADTAGLGTAPPAPITTPTTGTDTAGMGAMGTSPGADTAMMTTTTTPVLTEETSMATTTATTVVEEEEEGGFDWNWLGLLGLLGLAGLFKKRGTQTEVIHHDTVRPVDTTPGTRPRV